MFTETCAHTHMNTHIHSRVHMQAIRDGALVPLPLLTITTAGAGESGEGVSPVPCTSHLKSSGIDT